MMKPPLTMTIESIGDIEQTVQEVANLSRSLERQVSDQLYWEQFAKERLCGRDRASRKI